MKRHADTIRDATTRTHGRQGGIRSGASARTSTVQRGNVARAAVSERPWPPKKNGLKWVPSCRMTLQPSSTTGWPSETFRFLPDIWQETTRYPGAMTVTLRCCTAIHSLLMQNGYLTVGLFTTIKDVRKRNITYVYPNKRSNVPIM
jgi:hypothetical protein